MRYVMRVFVEVLGCLALWSATALASEPVTPPAGIRLGVLHVERPAEKLRGLVFLLSDLDGWNPALEQAAAALSAAGYGVAGVDLPTWLSALDADQDDTDCHYLVGDLEDAQQFLQHDWQVRRYRHAIVAGIGVGGGVAVAALADAPASTLAGAVALDGVAAIPTRRPFCPTAAATPVGAAGFTYDVPRTLGGWLVEARWHRAAHEDRWAALASPAQTISLDADLDLPAALIQAVEAGAPLAGPDSSDDSPLADLPLVELSVPHPTRSFAIVLSGDGGWRDIDKSIATVFVARGLPTVGLDSLRYFWTRHEPAEVAADLDRIVRHYRRAWHADKVVLVGYSFGADVLPAVWPLLAEDTRQAVVQVSLLALGTDADFEFHVAGWVGWTDSDARPIAPDLARMDRDRVQCFFGADEGPDETACRGEAAAGTEQVERPGGHHFDGDYAAIADAILAGLQRRGGGAW
jgi:type IV secretory pathway VirJ component